jgi:hypothetical protein
MFALALAAVFGYAIGPAQDPQPKPKEKTPLIDKREQNQKARIKQGVKSGELTKKEAVRLRAEQRKIENDKAKAQADGKVTPAERKKIRREERRSSRDIYRQKHDPQKRKN